MYQSFIHGVSAPCLVCHHVSVTKVIETVNRCHSCAVSFTSKLE